MKKQHAFSSLNDNRWIEVDLGASKNINSAELHIKSADVGYGKMTPFDLNYQDSNGRWVKLFSSQVFGELWTQEFEPVIAQRVKLFINTPGIRFFGLYSD